MRNRSFWGLLRPMVIFAVGAALGGRHLAAQLPATKDPLAGRQAARAEACSASDQSSCAQMTLKLLPVILGPSPLEENLRRLTNEVGGRVTGTPQMAKAVDWALAAFRAAGVDVHTEKYSLPVTWEEGKSSVVIIAPEAIAKSAPPPGVPAAGGGFALRAVSEAWGPATPAGGIDAAVVDVALGTADDFAKAGPVKGKVVLVHTEIGTSWADLFNEYMRPPEIIERARQQGAVAILWMGARERLLLYRHTNVLTGAIDRIPQALVAREDSMRLADALRAYPGKVRVHVELPNQIAGPVQQENVIGEIRGYEKPDEAVILGAHLDSWELGTGALDDGCNAALVIEAARAIKASGILPRRTIRFVLFSGEEQGTIGSYEYVRAHREEMDRIRAMIAFDAGIGRVTGYSLGGRRDLERPLREILRPIESWDINRHTYDASFGTDNMDFLLEGVPTLVANNEEANYLPNYHAASDTFDKVDIRELKLHTVIAALTAWGIADRTEPFGKRLSRSEVEQSLHETGMDQQMRVLGYWESWKKGERGRKP
jgi:carboxypeptidase Q